jgi:hypothetical protein
VQRLSAKQDEIVVVVADNSDIFHVKRLLSNTFCEEAAVLR